MKASLSSEPPTISIAAGEFKAKCLKLMDEANVAQHRITITKRGKPVGQFVPLPAEEKVFHSVIGRSPGIRVPKNFSEVRAGLAMDWPEPAEKWVQGKKSGKQKKR